MTKKLLHIQIICTTLILILCASCPVLAASAWKWKMSLVGEVPNNLFDKPTALFVDADKERYYVVDSGKNRLVSFDKEGKFLSAFNAEGQLKTPTDFVRDKQNRLWVLERGRNSITQVSIKEKKTIPHTLKNQGKEVFPDRLEFVGDLFYVLDRFSGDILSLNKKFNVVRRYSCQGCNGGFNDFVVHNGKIWGLSSLEQVIYGFSITGKRVAKIELTNNQVGFPRSFAFDGSGSLYVLDRQNSNIAVFDQKGRFKYSFLSEGQVREKLYYPNEIRFDPWGRLCVVDTGNGRVEVFSR